MVSLPPHLQTRPASRRETPTADKVIDDLLAHRPIARASVFVGQAPRSIQEGIALFRARVEKKNLQQLLDVYGGRGSLLDLLV